VNVDVLSAGRLVLRKSAKENGVSANGAIHKGQGVQLGTSKDSE
jgi:hypothetical protein